MTGWHEKRPGWLMARLLLLDVFFETRAACWLNGCGNLFWFWLYTVSPGSVYPVFAWLTFVNGVASFYILLLRADRAGR